MTVNNDTDAPGVRGLLILSVPALGIGIGAALVLMLLDLASGALHDVLWTALPAVFGVTSSTPWWVILVLTTTGAAVGLIVWLVPGHAGPDSARTEFDSPPPKLVALPSLFVVVVLSLAGGVSLGPENPMVAINAALAVAVLARFTKIPPQLAGMLAVAGTLGALFGTPVAAALVFTGIVGAAKTGGSLWDRLFLPVAAAGAGALTMSLLGGELLTIQVEPMGAVQPMYLLTGGLVAVAATVLGVVMAWLFPYVHRLFHGMRNPVLYTTLGGAVLGALAIIGGPLTMFKGFEETTELLQHPGAYSTGQLAAMAGIKALALLVAAGAGFRGGRIFPVVFIGAALGLLATALIPDLPIALAVACAVMGMTLVASRDGWIAMFVGIAVVGDPGVLPLLCVIVLPTWLIVTKAPALAMPPEPAPAQASASGTARTAA